MTNDGVVISSASRSKLNAFCYVDPDHQQLNIMATTTKHDGIAFVEKENETGLTSDKEAADSHDMETNPAPGEPQKQQIEPEKEPPQTPAHRIPLADLINNAEDAFINAPGKVPTPDDRVFWKHEPQNTDPRNSSATPATRRRKRHRSASPASSPLNRGSENVRPDPQSLQKLIKTPQQQDMIADLWSKYIGKNEVNPGDDPSKALFSLLGSSPHTPGVQRSKDQGLRRTNSCNIDWPVSNAKRRKIENDKQVNKVRDAFAGSRSTLLDTGRSKSSRISLLVEKIQETMLETPRGGVDGPSSSTPLPERPDDIEEIPSSPPKPVDENVPLDTPSKATTAAQSHNIFKDAGLDRKPYPAGYSSEYDDDDLDDEFLQLAGTCGPSAAEQTFPNGEDPQPNHTVAAPLPNAVSIQMNKSDSNQRETQYFQPAPPKRQGHGLDELHGSDDEFGDGMDELLANYDTKEHHVKGDTVCYDKGERSMAPQNTGAECGDTKPKIAEDSNALLKGDKVMLDDYDDDEFDDDIDVEAIEHAAMLKTGGAGLSSQNRKCSQAIKRYLILDLAETSYVNGKGQRKLEKVLFVQDERAKLNRAIMLRETWFDSPCIKNSYIHLIGEFDANGQCIVDDTNNMVVLHPDHLISATTVAESFTCLRRAVLQDRVKTSVDASKPQVYGFILHEIFQEAMKVNRWDLDWLGKLIDTVLKNYVENLYEVQVEITEATDYLMTKMPALSSWASVFMRYEPTMDSSMEDKNGTTSHISINKLLEVEEHIWSPMYGLKGNVDATVQVAVKDGPDLKTLTVPFELKTGRKAANESHRAQTALYSLLLSDRYDIDVTFGILYYLEISKTFRVRAIRNEMRQMIQQRNRLATFVVDRTKLPPMVQRPRICNQCYAKKICFTYHKLLDNGNEETSGMGNSFLEIVGHLTAAHQVFFEKWDTLLTLEEKDMMKFRRELWTMLSNEREAVGRCFGNIMIEPGSASEDPDGPKINRFRYSFIKPQAPTGFSFTESQLTVGEPIVISDEKGHFALSNGYVTHISPRRITVAVDRRLHNARTKSAAFDAQHNQSFTGIMEIVEEGGRQSTIIPENTEDTNLYRLDKDEFSNGMATVRNNLICMMDKYQFRAKRLRELIIENAAPSFKQLSASTQALCDNSQLNVDQKRAIEKVMSANDYALVLGMPGTGKTTTIAHIIRALISQGKSVLLTSYTHTAVDNILLKIRDDNIRTLRLGATAKVHPDVQQFADLGGVRKKTMEELRDSYENCKIVATTCLGVNHPIFNSRTFDYCIVDEASQITLPVCLGPIRMASTFILVGDHYQLPPLVQNKEALQNGLDVSLFKSLCDSHPSSVVTLEHQYRMCEDIMSLSNTLIYSGRLKCGTKAVASNYLKIPNFNDLKHHHGDPITHKVSATSNSLCLGSRFGRCWLRDLLDPVAKARLVNTDLLTPPAEDSAQGARIVNPTEATLCAQLVEALISVGIPAREIGVVTLYRSQLSLLRQKLRHHLPSLEMHTADRFQGRDKEVIIMSCVRSNSERNVGELLRDWRRVNVAFTRARTKLLIVGSKTTLRDGNELLGKFVRLMDGKGWTYDLPPDAVESHVFEEQDAAGFTQLSPMMKKEKKRRGMSATPSPTRKKMMMNNNTVSPLKKKSRAVLSPAKNRQGLFKQPEKMGGKRLDGEKILRKRPVLRDMVNEFIVLD
ncbi:hypothetical protein AJ80_00879 [Polytolypa hystricis UAMH7299]|uniref:DNA replication ATP-dependent helicase/nuclease n=1 Tax=Polytolypa hystricis (strain UAMH7299) TaxID=1447883 RepID=A0A2B7Z255_POLH7|nr:hypothetical protein AJ80_00879 [Polytolypa hystricis UAMH7299]